MNFNTIIFDWDGTLCRTLRLWLDGYQHGLGQLGFALTEPEIAADFLHGHSGLPEKYPGLDYDRLLGFAFSHVLQNLPQAGLYANAKRTLDALRARGIKVALVSTSPRKVLMTGVLAHGVEGTFASILAGDEVDKIKPDPQPFVMTLQALGAKPCDTLIIGDNRTDIEAGKAAGVQTCLFTPIENNRYHDFDHLRSAKADFEINDLALLLA